MCKLWLVVDYLVCTASVFNIVLISFDRFISVTKAVRAGQAVPSCRELGGERGAPSTGLGAAAGTGGGCKGSTAAPSSRRGGLGLPAPPQLSLSRHRRGELSRHNLLLVGESTWGRTDRCFSHLQE